MKQSQQSDLNEAGWDFTIPRFLVPKPIHFPKYSLSTYFFILILAGFISNQILLLKVNSSAANSTNHPTPTVSPSPVLSAFDQSMVAKLKNEGKSYPILGTAHNHANIKFIVSGKPFNFANPQYYMKSSLLHIDNNKNLEDSGSVLHMHAKDVSLWWFFESLGMKLEKDSLILADGQILKNGNGNSLKFYLNGKKVDELNNYVFQPLDKILISFGPENDPGIQSQVDSVPNFAKDHQK